MNLGQLDKVIPQERLKNVTSSLSREPWQQASTWVPGTVFLSPEIVNEDQEYSHQLDVKLGSGNYGLGVQGAKRRMNLKGKIDIQEGAKVLLVVAQEWNMLQEEMLDQQIHIELGQGAELELVVLGVHPHAGLMRSFFEINLKKNAQLNLYCIVTQGSFEQQRFCINLKEEGASSRVHSLSLTQKNNFLGVQCVVTHEAPRTVSNISLRALLAGPSQSVQQGQIVVLPGAEKIEGRYHNKNIVLSPRAQLYTQPALEISCDDVVCAHGVSIGNISDQEVFYLQARGINKEQAQKLLLMGICLEILNMLPFSLETYLDRDLTELLAGR